MVWPIPTKAGLYWSVYGDSSMVICAGFSGLFCVSWAPDTEMPPVREQIRGWRILPPVESADRARS